MSRSLECRAGLEATYRIRTCTYFWHNGETRRWAGFDICGGGCPSASGCFRTIVAPPKPAHIALGKGPAKFCEYLYFQGQGSVGMVEPAYSSIAQSRGKVCDRRRHGLPISPMKAN
jgi:hypothetical protein